MNKTTLLVLGAFAAAVIGWLSIQPRDPGVHIAAGSASVAVDAGPPDADGLDEIDFDPTRPPALALDGGTDEIELDLDAGFEMPDGGKLPELSDAPKSVQFGVVLVQFKGAQGAKSDARSYEDAKKLAAELAPLAKEDFEAAVKKGDPGSTTDAGRMFRNILEPAPEAILFSLDKGAVSDPVDTPRGIWIVKRNK